MNCSTLGNRVLCLHARYRFLDTEGRVRGGSVVSPNNDRDWLDVYRAAAMEFDRSKLPARIDVAEKAIHKRLRGLPIAHSQEHRELRDALNSLAVLKRML